MSRSRALPRAALRLAIRPPAGGLAAAQLDVQTNKKERAAGGEIERRGRG